jgi:hypothetical protein
MIYWIVGSLRSSSLDSTKNCEQEMHEEKVANSALMNSSAVTCLQDSHNYSCMRSAEVFRIVVSNSKGHGPTIIQFCFAL